MTIDFRTLANQSISKLTPYKPGKPILELERELGIHSSIKLASNENPFGPSPKALQAAQLALPQGHIYPDSHCYELKQALAQFLKVEPLQLTIGNGSENLLELIVKSYLTKGDTAVISQYAFFILPILIQSYGAEMNVAQADAWGHDVHAMVNAIDEKTRLIFLVNPNNPTGTYVNDDQFQFLMKSVPKEIIVVLDEAYAEYVENKDYPNALSYLQHYPNLIIARTFSKAYGLAGLRLGYTISSPEIADILNRARLPFNVNMIASKMGIAALQDQDHLKKTLDLNRNGLIQLQEGFTKLGLRFIPSVCNFVTGEVSDAVSIYEKLLREGIIVRSLHAFGMPQHIRVTTSIFEHNERFLSGLAQCL